MSLNDALAYVKGRRSVVNPNEGFIAQLRDYEGILRARFVCCSCIHVCVVLYIAGVCMTCTYGQITVLLSAGIMPFGAEWHQVGHL